jgi:hypothetical protein
MRIDRISPLIVCCGSALLIVPLLATAPDVALLELPAYTAWCSPIVVEAGDKAESLQADAWAAFMRAVDARLVIQSRSASGLPYVARAEVAPAAADAPARVKHDACVVVPPDIPVGDPAPGEAALVRRAIDALEKVVVKVCASDAAICLDGLRAELQTDLATIPPDTVATWPFRVVPFGGAADDLAAIKSALLATDVRPLATPVKVEGTIAADVPELGMDGKPVLRPLRTAPTGTVTSTPQPTPPTVLVAITIPPDAAEILKGQGQ